MKAWASLLIVAMSLGDQAFAQQGNMSNHEEKADVLGRDLQFPLSVFDMHDGVMEQYTTGDPDDLRNSWLIEMLGPSTSAIITNTLQNFHDVSQYRGSFGYLNSALRRSTLTRAQRVQIVQAITNMRDRPTPPGPIGYVSSPVFDYLDWTDTNSNNELDLDEIENMRSDAVVEFAYAVSGFPIVMAGLNTIITAPNTFKEMADHLVGGLRPKRQLMYMSPAIVDTPAIVVYNANNVQIPDGGSSSMTAVSIYVSDFYSGPGRLEIWLGPISDDALEASNNVDFDSSAHLYTSVDTGLSLLANVPNGLHTVRAIDQAGNYSSGEFKVSTGAGSSSGQNAATTALPASQASTDCYTAVATDTVVGIESISIAKDGGGFFSSATFQCPVEAKFGPHCALAAGSYTTTAQNCAGTQWTYASTVTAASNSVQICGTDPSNQTECESATLSAAQLIGTSSITVKTTGAGFHRDNKGKMCLGIATSAFGIEEFEEAGCEIYDQSNNNIKREFEGPASWWAGTTTFRVWNNNPGSTQAINIGLNITVEFFDLNGNRASTGLQYILGGSPDYYANPGEGIDGTIAVSEVGQPYPIADAPQVFKASPTIKNVQISLETLSEAMWEAIRRGVMAFSALPRRMAGSEIVFTSTIPISFTYQDSPGGVQTSTSSLRIYRWSGVEWDSSTVTGLWVSKDSGSGVIIASGAVSRTGLYAAMFDGQDSSAPNTAWSIQGSSSGFAGITFVSTYSYLVVSSTDPTVNGFASGVATTYYRIDGLPGDAYSVYSTSLSFLPGTHWVDSYAEDYAGNVSSVTRATVTVTAGSVTQLTSSLQVDGNLLVGFLGSGAKAEVVARAEYDYALMVSSVDGRAMLAVDNANFASIGTAPASGRLTLAGVAGDTALALRSGNSTASVTGAQLGFGYDGTSDLRHALYTQHGSADYNNKLVFKLWTPATGSSATLGNLPVLSLEGSSKTPSGALVHIMPAGLGENELVVSNGSGLGLGNVLRWERWQPSDSKLKTAIQRLGPMDVARAWADLMSLNPARYRRKANGPAAPLERGYILEEVPKSLRMGSGISVDERLVNVELALIGAIAEMNALEERLTKLKAGRR